MKTPARGPADYMMAARPAVRFLPAAGVLAVWIALLQADGGYFARDWAPAGIVVTALFLLAAIGGGRLVPDGAEARAALGALAFLVALAFLSTSWSESKAGTWEAASQFLTVLLAVWTLALLPWRPASAQLFFALFAGGAAIALGGSLVSALSADDLTNRFIENRWAQPIGYPNGLGNFGFFAALPMLAISAAPGRSVPAKAGALALATFLGGCALLPQSRGSVVAVMVALGVLVLLSPRRWRAAARVAVFGAALAAVASPVFDVYDAAVAGSGAGAALDDAFLAIVGATLVAGAAGLGLALLESRVRLGENGERMAQRAGLAATALLAVGAIGVAAVNADRIDRFVDRQRDAWESPAVKFEDADRSRGTRLLSSDPLQRYQYWHVSLDAFADKPLAGIGAGGFGDLYTRVRNETKYSDYPHSLFMRILAEGGILGVLGVLAFLAAVLAGLARGMREARPGDRAVAAGALAAASAFIVHAQLDWLEEFPALIGPVIAFLLIATVVRRREAEPEPEAEESRPALARPALAAALVAAVVVWAVLVPQYASLRYRERAIAIWRTDAPKAYRDLDRASALNPFSGAARLTEGTIALQRREFPRAREAFEASLEREQAWLAHFELALVLAAEGDTGAAVRQLERARTLNPQEPAISAAEKEIASGKVVDPVRLNRRLFESPLFISRRLT
jgi:O-antigen ligase